MTSERDCLDELLAAESGQAARIQFLGQRISPWQRADDVDEQALVTQLGALSIPCRPTTEWSDCLPALHKVWIPTYSRAGLHQLFNG